MDTQSWKYVKVYIIKYVIYTTIFCFYFKRKRMKHTE